jgi:hypothetical protein
METTRQTPDELCLILGRELVFPNSSDRPTLRHECFRRFFVPRSIPLNFFLPITDIGARAAAMSPATMPKTPIDEDCDSKAWENKIGQTTQRIPTPPASRAEFSQQRKQPELSGRVAGAADGSHDGTSGFGTNGIGHARHTFPAWWPRAILRFRSENGPPSPVPKLFTPQRITRSFPA